MQTKTTEEIKEGSFSKLGNNTKWICVDEEFLTFLVNTRKVLNNATSMGFSIVSSDVVHDLNEDQHDRLRKIFYKYHNANCGPFDRYIEHIINECSQSSFKEVKDGN